MKTRFSFLLAVHILATVVLIALIAVGKPNETGLLVILVSVILVTVVVITGVVVMMAIESAAARIESLLQSAERNSYAKTVDNRTAS